MPDAKIFLLGKDALTLVPMPETAFVTEEELQLLLAKYNDLLPGDQIDVDEPRRWLFVGREVTVPGGVGEVGWLSLDHLFLDQEAIPTFVECKRSSDTRARREVVAQMLDYAANGTEYWTADRLRQLAAESADRRGRQLDEAVKVLAEVATEAEVEQFWTRVDENLRLGRVRLIFVVDQAPRELLRLTEFLNEQMRDTEVLLLEIKQFRSEHGERALVPRLLGRPERTRPRTPARATNSEAFSAKCSAEAATFFERMWADASSKGYSVQWGTVGFSVRVQPRDFSRVVTFAYGYPPNIFDFWFDKQLPFSAETGADLRQRLLSIGVFTESGQRTLRARLTPESLDKAQDAWRSILEQIDAIR